MSDQATIDTERIEAMLGSLPPRQRANVERLLRVMMQSTGEVSLGKHLCNRTRLAEHAIAEAADVAWAHGLIDQTIAPGRSGELFCAVRWANGAEAAVREAMKSI